MPISQRHFAIALAPFLIAASAHGALVYTPAKFEAATAKMVVVIHGCLQSPESMALGAGWNQLADANNFVVVYPRVPEGSNPMDCWSWYLPENQKKDSGQLKLIMDEITSVKQGLKLKSPDVFLAGISSGGAMVSGLLACYPGEFKAGAIHSGPSYAVAGDLKEGEKALRDGPSATAPAGSCKPHDFKGSVLVVQGTLDVVVNPKNARRVISDFVGTAEESSTKDLQEGGLRYTVADFKSEKGAKGRLVMVHGLGHTWAGSDANLKFSSLLGSKGKMPTVIPFFTGTGPSSTNLIWDFLRTH